VSVGAGLGPGIASVTRKRIFEPFLPTRAVDHKVTRLTGVADG
jgi:hypothetical protein